MTNPAGPKASVLSTSPLPIVHVPGAAKAVVKVRYGKMKAVARAGILIGRISNLPLGFAGRGSGRFPQDQFRIDCVDGGLCSGLLFSGNKTAK